MSDHLPAAEEREETLCSLPLHLPLKVRVVTDVGGVSILGVGPFKGSTGAGRSYSAALAEFFDGLFMDYYEFELYPSEVQSEADTEKGKLLRRLFHGAYSGSWQRRKK